MSFFEEYKHLDGLCKRLLGTDKGVTAYIEYMDEHPEGRNKVEDWNQVYKKLKTYRHIRNQIAHDENIRERDLVKAEDTRWVKAFSKRIEKKKDPVSQLKGKQTKSFIGRLFGLFSR